MLVTQKAFKGKCIFLHFLQQMTDILFMFELDIRQNMKFSYVCHSLSWDSILEIKTNKKLLILIVKSDLSSTHADNLSFNLIELLFIILVITCCSRTFLPHFLAENFKKSMQHLLVFFLLAVPMYNVILCAYYIFLWRIIFMF